MARAAQTCRPSPVSIHHGIVEPHGEQYEAVFPTLTLQCRFDFLFDPCTRYGLFRQNQEQFVVDADRLIDDTAELVSNF